VSTGAVTFFLVGQSPRPCRHHRRTRHTKPASPGNGRARARRGTGCPRRPRPRRPERNNVTARDMSHVHPSSPAPSPRHSIASIARCRAVVWRRARAK
jgi:hypothetical protein